MAPVQGAVYEPREAARKRYEGIYGLEEAPPPGPPADGNEPPRWTPPVERPAAWGATGPANTRPLELPARPPETPPTSAGVLPRRSPPQLALLAAVAGVSAIIGGLLAGSLVAWLSDDSQDASGAAASTPQTLSVEQTSAIAEAAARARPSVVRIESTKRVAGGTEQDVGSGVVLDAEGHVVTNAHVVLETDSLKVILPDGTERPAILVGHDYPFSDVAVLQIGPGRLTPIEAGDSSALILGQTVIAIGNPLAEFEGSVSVGVISGIDRVRTLDGVRQSDFVQTDAAVNSGNSGGALVNLQGQFVGMPTAVIRQSRSGTVVEGIAFALPANRVLTIAREIIRRGGQYPRPSLQAEHIDLTPEVLARLSRSTVREGALISSVVPGGAAAEAGIQAGDVVTRLGDSPVSTDFPLYNALLQHEAGESVRVVLNRNGRIIEVEVRLAERS